MDWLNLAGAKKVHSLVDKIYKMKNLEMAWEKVRQNKGAGGIDGEDIDAFEKQVAVNLQRLYGELESDTYQPQPVRQKEIPKPGQPGKYRTLARLSGFDGYFNKNPCNFGTRVAKVFTTRGTPALGRQRSDGAGADWVTITVTA